MSSVLVMEWNGKPPIQWDWDENSKKLEGTDWPEMEAEKGLDSGSLNSSVVGSGGGSGGSSNDLGLASFSKGSKSPSINSSSNFSLKDSVSGKLGTAKAGGASAAPEASIGSGEPLLSLKLGKRPYFEDVCAGTGSTAKTSSISSAPPSSVAPPKRSKSGSHGSIVPRCLVEGCNRDLSSAKDYHRKHRVCEEHSKCPKVRVNGLELRFCQQCSRFHDLSEFDEKKRSCRRRLSDHNARRRKPPQELNSSRPPALYGERQEMSFLWNKSLLVHAATNSNLTWDTAKDYVSAPAKAGNIDGQQHVPVNGPTGSMPMHHSSCNGLLHSKGKLTSGASNQGLEGTVISSNVDAAQDFHRALSLLSTNTWDSCAKPVSLEQPFHKNSTSVPLSVIPEPWPGGSSELWRTEQQPADTHVDNSTAQSNGNSYYQEFQLLRGPYGPDFYSDQLH